jgi:pantoate--beta-alanine ligase
VRVISTVAGLRDAVTGARREGRPVALIPTMGALHAGHLSLVEAARCGGAFRVASIFVNPLQFGPTEDLARYPRPVRADEALLEGAGVDVLFRPSVEEMYPPGTDTRVFPGRVAEPLEGERRPGHFIGVATVVARLFGAATPDRAYFGQKDAQQLAVIQAMVRDLAMPVEVIGCPIVREPDGLAMSSRNGYLDSTQRARSQVLVRSLAAAQALSADGVMEPRRLEEAMSATIAAEAGVELDYVSVVETETFRPAEKVGPRSLALVAARLGSTRLIDNALAAGSDVLRFANRTALSEVS